MPDLVPSQRLRARLLEAFTPIAGREGWTEAALSAAAREAGLSEGEKALAAPQGVRDMAEAFAARADAAMEAALAGTNLTRIRERVRAGIWARLEAQATHRDAVAALTRWLARPTRAPLAAQLAWKTADALWRALGDSSTDENYYSKRAILTGVLGSVYARWLTDAAPYAKTADFLDARIANVMQIETLKARARPHLARVLDAAAGIAARARYPEK